MLQSIRKFAQSLMDAVESKGYQMRSDKCPMKFVMNKPRNRVSQYASKPMQLGKFSSVQITLMKERCSVRQLVTSFQPY